MSGRLGATYRLQLGPQMTFDDATALVDYLVALGIECLYCSPVAEAVPGSPHGYDGTDPTKLRDELGGATAFRHLAKSLAAAGLGCVIDIVPNHLSTWTEGPWWRDVLRNGQESELAEVFDVDWVAGGGKVNLPLLDRPLQQVLASGAITRSTRPDGEEVLDLGGVTLPVRGGRPRPDEDLEEVLAAQAYRLVDWHERGDHNYRRFFDIDGLIGVHVERSEVFTRTHALVEELVRDELVTALRVDHVDGLADPGRYLARLHRLTDGLPVIVEKILTGEERLRSSWPVAGTTGYEVIDDIGGALVDPVGFAALAHAAAGEGEPPVDATTTATRRLVAETTFSTELERASVALGVELSTLIDASIRLPVYRTYLDGGPVHPDDARAIAVASSTGDPPLSGNPEGLRWALADPGRAAGTTFWQQVTGAVMAKGIEDTAWYRLPGRMAFCEVGGDPARDRSDGVSRMHARAAARSASGHAGLIPSTTHDTKRSGDARARLYALSELAEGFEEGLRRFREQLLEALSPMALRGDLREVLGEQSRPIALTLLSVLPPLSVRPPLHDEDPDSGLADRLTQALVKSVREAKMRSSWDDPDRDYEELVGLLIDASLAQEARIVQESFGSLVSEVARIGATLSLSSVVLRSVLPGVPDCYQGDEAWNLALVDPDNRRTVEFGSLRDRLTSLGIDQGQFEPAPGEAARLRCVWRTGDVKLHVTAGCLHARKLAPSAFAPSAAEHPIEVTGETAASVLAFERHAGPAGPDGRPGRRVIAVATRLAGRLATDGDDLPAGTLSYGGAVLALPGRSAPAYLDALTGRTIGVVAGELSVAEVLEELPVALLVEQRGGGA